MAKGKKVSSNKLNIFAKKTKNSKKAMVHTETFGRTKVIYFVFFIALIFAVMIIKSSYSYFKKEDTINNFSVIVGNLEYELVCDVCSDGKVVLNANSSKVVNLSITNKNPIDFEYKLYYKNLTDSSLNDEIDAKYLNQTIDEVLEKDETKRIAVVLTNNSDTQKTLEINIRPSLITDEATLLNDEIHINEMITSKEEGVIITDVQMIDEDTTDIDSNNTETIYKYQNTLGNKITLSKTNSSSKASFEITMKNYTDIEQRLINLGTSYFTQNKNITYTITGLSAGDKLASGKEITFTVTFHYVNNKIPNEDNENYIENYNILDLSMKFNFGLSETEIVNTTTYSIYSKEQKLPVIINNNNNYDITGVVSYNGTKLTEEISIPANKTNYMIPVDISSIYESLTEGLEDTLDFELTEPYSELYNNAVVFKKEKQVVSITNIETYINDTLVENDTINYNENSIMIDNSLNSTNSKITYKITVKNNDTNFGYKFRNITDVFNSNKTLNYKTNIDLSTSVIVKSQQKYTFEINYEYDSSSLDNTHKQILLFDFKREFLFEGTTDSMIAYANRANSTSSKYGDFGVIEEDFTSPTMSCTYEECYSDNGGELLYNEDGALVLDDNNAISLLNIDQSMSVEDEYSIYFTVKGDTYQSGEEAKNGGFPATILAISEDSTKYLTWIGFYKNYLHVYSYYNNKAKANIDSRLVQTGFISFDVSEYSNKIMNIQVVGKRGGNTKIYINGVLLETIASGSDIISYTYATVGDLRPGRNLKFTGELYDLGIYNKALTEEEVALNWNFANNFWNITE